ncbi:MAG: NAD(+) diphosphatase [Caldilinea sp.]
MPPPLAFLPAVRAPEVATPARWYLYQEDRLVLDHRTGDPLLPLARTADELRFAPLRTQYLGQMEGAAPLHCFSGELSAAASLPADFHTHELRSLFEVFPEEEVVLAGRARQVVQWERDHQFCGRCGSVTDPMPNERARRCPACDLTSYPRISPAIIVAVTRQCEEGPRILLARNQRFPAGRYSVVAGFVEPGETLEECVHREVAEETGISITNLRYFHSQPWPFPNSLMLAFTAEYAGGDFLFAEEEIADAQWFSPTALPLLPPKISIARKLIDDFIRQHAPNTLDPP